MRRDVPDDADTVPWLGPEQAARRIGLSRRQLDRLHARGEGPVFYQLSERTRRYHPDDLVEWLRAARREPSAS